MLNKFMGKKFQDSLKHPKRIINFRIFDPVPDKNLDSKIAAELLDMKESEKFQNLLES